MMQSNKLNRFSIVEQLAIMFYVLAEINADLFANRVIYASSVILLFVTFYSKTTSSPSLNTYAKWSIAWSFVVAASFFYTVSPSYTGMSILVVSLRCVIMYTFLCRLQSPQTIVQLMYILIFASLLNSVYMLSMVDFEELGEERLGKSTIDERWNANTIGMQLTFNVFFIFYLFQNKFCKRPTTRFYLLICTILFVFIILMTGSRKALFLLVLPILFYYMLATKKSSKLQKVTAVVTVLLLIYLLIMTIEPLYNVLGVRVERLMESIGGTTEDRSIMARRALRDMGLRWFIERPIFGYGMNSFEPMCGHATGQYWYSHNNYIEILVGTGIIGLITYYSLYLWMFEKSIRKHYKNYGLGLSLLIPILFSETGLVSYKTFIIQFVLMIISAYIFLDKPQVSNKSR